MSTISDSPSPIKKNPVWNDQVKIGRGRSDTGAFHRAIAVAVKLFESGRWNGRGLLVVHEAYDTHLKMEFYREELVEGVDFEYAADTTFSGGGPDEPAPQSNGGLRLVWRPSVATDFRTGQPMVFWRLYTSSGVRFTPDVLDSKEVVLLERGIRLSSHETQVAFQYWQPEWM